jgi:antitoxin component YwqK of YwqJK toxin-antitoxin module
MNKLEQKLFWDNGKLYYVGEIANNMKHGYGRKYNSDGQLEYEGFFKNDLFCGRGKLFYPDNTILFEGEFLNDCLKHGAYYWKDGKYYIGEMKNDLIHGNGILYNKDNTVEYDGSFQNGMKYGFGKLYHSNNNNNNNNNISYIGCFINNCKTGDGIEYNEDGTIFRKGTFFNNEFIKGIKYIGLSPYYIGEFRTDLYHGYGTLYNYINNIHYEGIFANGVKHGIGKLYHDNGCISYSGEFINNLKNGYGTEYNYAGAPVYSGNFVNDTYSIIPIAKREH